MIDYDAEIDKIKKDPMVIRANKTIDGNIHVQTKDGQGFLIMKDINGVWKVHPIVMNRDSL